MVKAVGSDGRLTELVDKILLAGLQFFGRHGTLDAEETLGQMFVVDIELEADLSRAAQSDDLNDTVDYSAIYRETKAIVEGPRARLIEHLAGKIADFVLKDARVVGVRVRVKKPQVALGGVLDFVGVEVERRRNPGEREA